MSRVLVACADGRTYDIRFRMLEPHELAAAMGFDAEDQPYEFAGTKTEKIKQIGNAVSVAKMKACVGAIMADAAPKKRAARRVMGPPVNPPVKPGEEGDGKLAVETRAAG